MKLKSVFVCEKCGCTSPKWAGRCPECDSWNSFVEDVVDVKPERVHVGLAAKLEGLTETVLNEKRLSTDIAELDRVLGGGLVAGSVILVSGEPGIGKSTLTLNVCANIAKSARKILYVSGEESSGQISLRAKRLGVKNENIFLVPSTSLENILATLEKEKPDFVVIDSIQVVSSPNVPGVAGSVSQVRFCAESLIGLAKKNGLPLVIVGHVTKDGNLAGPKILEHMVDAVLLIEGERHQNMRLVRSLKNRFGSTNEIGLFEMVESGLKEVQNASRFFLEGRKEGSFGSVITSTMEGTRPLLIEVQALTSLTTFGYPRRAASGFDLNRLQLLIAVIQKHLGLNLLNQDVFINVVGGFRIADPAVDLAVVMAIISSFKKEPAADDAVYIGEVGLSGELRTVPQIDRRVREAAKIGFKKIFVPKMGDAEGDLFAASGDAASSTSGKNALKGVTLTQVSDIRQLIKGLIQA
jgi:DNA repair protein RadA/Sms